jgi:hypothetical protein
VDSDNGSEFINWHLKNWCEQQKIQLTRGRPYKKDDNAHIEQKNWTHVRKMLGWERYDTPEVVEAINDLYSGEMRLLLNLFLPSVKLLKKVRVGSKVRRVYDAPRTPLERVQACPEANAETVARLQEQKKGLDPFQLSKHLYRKLDRIYRRANRRLSPKQMQRPKMGRGSGGENGCGKVEIKTRFPLSHSHGGDGTRVTFQMSRRSTPGLHS